MVAKRREKQRSGFAGDARESEQDAGQDAALGGRDDDGGDRFPLAGAESHGAFAKRVGNGAHETLRCCAA